MCVIEDTINNPTCSNGVLPSRTPLTSQPAAMVSCPHYSSLCLSVVFSFCLGLSLTRRSSLALSLSLARARSLLLEGSSTFVPSRTPLASQPAGMVSCSHPLSSSLPISGSLSLCLCLCPSLFQVCLRLVLPGARRTARSNTCPAGLARSPVGAAPAQQAVQRCALQRPPWGRAARCLGSPA